MNRIFISAGHSLGDPGASTAIGTTESQEMMKTRQLIIDELKAKNYQENVDFFSVPDTYSLGQTIQWINQRAKPGDVALEIHGNAANGNAKGTECFYIFGNAQRKENAKLLLKALLDEVPKLKTHGGDNGAKPDTESHPGSLAFCRQVSIPSLLLELCFVDNAQDMDLLRDNRKRFAQGIVNGLITWSGDVIPPSDYPTIDIEINGQLYDDKGILVNNNSYVPMELVDSLNIEIAPDVRRIDYGHVVYLKAVDLDGVTVGWKDSPKTLTLTTKNIPQPLNSIMGVGKASATQLSAFLKKHNSGDHVGFFHNLAELYVSEAKIEGVNHDIAFCQMCLETGFLRFGGDVKPSQYNFAGVGAVGGGAAGASFPNEQIGIRAQIQHLKAYASTKSLKQSCVDPRFHLVTRGCGPTVDKLAGKWAADLNYGNQIMKLLKELYTQIQMRPVLALEITSPEDGRIFEFGDRIIFEGTADAQMTKVELYAEDKWLLGSSMVENGQWSVGYQFTAGGKRLIVARGLDQNNQLVASAEMDIMVRTDSTVDLNLKLSPDFTLGEFVRSETAERHHIDNTPTATEIEHLRRLCLQILQPARDALGPISVNSGYRCPKLNELLRSSPNSAHRIGYAADVVPQDVSTKRLADWIRTNCSFDQLIREYGTLENPAWIHVSADPRNRMEDFRIG
ncbi:N-acetylmuramoyl-L-alanine amidase [Crocosphaera sp. XPORK-15E]|uniref:hormogonium tapered terminus morphoprotein TftA n=1 Tax=Crocosphaera sp. XPORK-15E TaxID=3110247 RepID=UPI002B1F1C16|nr:N-acetylmuramoyl-L-alanine amidase [Crocosphaera sp. XPORK-15E]MEA5534941.1 N-acetylmuramoyl-L-alanine amidase [Crocosphaera sp. XPORK-15E]